jgi:two-component system, OmpR family, sensor histidine kinase TctE
LWDKLTSAVRGPSLLKALVVRLILVVTFAVLLSLGMLLLEFHSGVTGIDDQSIAVQVESLRAAVETTQRGPRVSPPRELRELYASASSLNGFQFLSADGALLDSGGFVAPMLPLPTRANGDDVIMQREVDPRTGQGVLSATVPIERDGKRYWLRVVRNLQDVESLSGQLILRAIPEFLPVLIILLVAVIAVVMATVHSSLRPLRQVSRQAAALSGDRLSDRLHDRRLPREVVPLVQAVNFALDRLEADYKSQREFTAHAAHELRTPLAILRARLEARFTPDEVGDLGLEIDSLARLVEQLLCLAQLDSELEFESVPLDAYSCAVDVARDIAPLALAKNHNLSAGTPGARVAARGNETLIRLVFRNLIENAIQHTAPGTSICVSAPDASTVIVEDDGAGIPEDQRALIFERFRRGASASGTGAGLGLAIARRVMARAGGLLLLDPNVKRGTRFVVAFPPAVSPSGGVSSMRR